MSQSVWPDWAIFKGLAKTFRTELAQMFHYFLGVLKKMPMYVKLLWLSFGHLYEKFELRFIPRSVANLVNILRS